MKTADLVEKAKTDLIIALDAVRNGAAAHLFEIAEVRLPNGETWSITCGMFMEPQALLVEALLEGQRQAVESYAKNSHAHVQVHAKHAPEGEPLGANTKTTQS